jgi:tetratricopeptide (TPR) repeat protein
MRIRAHAFALLVALAPVWVYAPDVAAQGEANEDPFTDMARKRFQEGVKLFDQGKFEEARAAFLQAYALKKHPAVLLNLAQSELRSDHPVEAARHFSEFLRDNPGADAAERKAAQDGLTAARTKTGRIDIKVNVAGADVLIDGELVGRAPLPEPVDVPPGAHKLEARLAGYQSATADATAEIGKSASASLSLSRDGAAPAAAAGEPSSDDAAADEGVSISTDGRKPFLDWAAEDKIAWATGGATVVGLGMGIYFMFAARSASNNADNIAGQIKVVAERDDELDNYQGFDRTGNPCADPVPVTSGTDYTRACSQLQDNLDARDTDKTLSIVGWVVTGLGVAGTGVAYYIRTDPSKTSDAAVTEPPKSTAIVAPVISPGFTGLAVGGTF